jgi:hypothetical protein
VFVPVFVQEGQAYADENGLFFIETSAKSAQNVNEVFYEIGKPPKAVPVFFGKGFSFSLSRTAPWLLSFPFSLFNN